MTRYIPAFFLGLALVASPGVIVAATPGLTSRPVMTLALAERLLQAGVREAARNGWPGVVAVVDDAGQLMALTRMDNAYMRASVDLAPGKARTAVMFHRPTAILEGAIDGPRPALVTAQGYVMMKGGEPIVIDGQLVGGIGVSLDTPEHDEQVALAALAGVK
ncbi:GlcG/HbpS family heme-binding protein [Gluconacetobacter tumulisoli]|uniref:Heme-binding protein n=1 Tax=Gluconacetobacter tumulisoli TaxID=1286189 RepID=A0A7W4PK29_9PROT|nr:heme-binding protein [Gluconacetobacter tumulisoli]MBB2200977.1 heme-binding protein [Gluconacetobacter tumulisoli]